MQGMSQERIEAKNIRRKTLDILFEKYPNGFTVKNMLTDYPDVFTTRSQASEYLALIKDSEGSIKLVRRGNSCFYTRYTDVYKLLNKLWQTPQSIPNTTNFNYFKY